MKYKIQFTLIFSILSFVILMNCSSDDDSSSDAPSGLEYSIDSLVVTTGGGVSEVPVVTGSSPFRFSIISINEQEGADYSSDNDAITINPDNGVISVKDGQELVPGIYELDINVSNRDGNQSFTGAFRVIKIAPPSDLIALSGTWLPIQRGVIKNVELRSEWGEAGFSVTFSITDNVDYMSGSFAVSNLPDFQDFELIWPASGTWQFDGTPENPNTSTVIRSDGVEMSITISDNQAVISFSVVSGSESVQGDWSFFLQRS